MRGGTWREEEERRAGHPGGGGGGVVVLRGGAETAVGVRTVRDLAVVVHPDPDTLNGIFGFQK